MTPRTTSTWWGWGVLCGVSSGGEETCSQSWGMTGPARLLAPFRGEKPHGQARCLTVHTPRVVIWTTSDPDSTRTALSRRAARPRLLVPVPHGTFVLGPVPHTSE